jgi:hypothetical protein
MGSVLSLRPPATAPSPSFSRPDSTLLLAKLVRRLRLWMVARPCRVSVRCARGDETYGWSFFLGRMMFGV